MSVHFNLMSIEKEIEQDMAILKQSDKNHPLLLTRVRV